MVRKALAADDEDALSILNQRAVVVRDRMGLDLVQIYNVWARRVRIWCCPASIVSHRYWTWSSELVFRDP